MPTNPTPRVSHVQIIRAPGHLGPAACALTRVVSDSGAAGYGELGVGPDDDWVDAVEWVASGVLGVGVTDRQAAWHRLQDETEDWDGEEWMIAAAVAGLDCAMWDLAARELGVPAGVLMGGLVRRRLDLCVECGDLADEASVAGASAHLGAGIRAFSFTVDALDGQLRDRLRDLRRVLGMDPLVVLEVRSSPATVEAATALGMILDQAEPYWIEGLLPDGQWSELARVRTAIGSPVGAGGETVGARPFWRALESQCADIVTPCLARCGGVTGALRLADMVDTKGLRMSLRAGDSLVSVLAAAQVCFARQGVSPVRAPLSAVRLLTEWDPGLVQDGFLLPCTGPGLGTVAAANVEYEVLAELAAD